MFVPALAALATVAIACTIAPSSPDAAPPDTSDPDAATLPPADALDSLTDASTAEYPCAPAASIGHQHIDCPGGVGVDVEAPAQCPAGGCGLVLDIHGFTMDADQQDDHTRMRALAPALGYIVVQPSAPGALPSWAGGDHDDMVWGVTLAVIDVFDVNPDRVHVMGFSQGGEMTLRLLCEHSEQIASVAPSAGSACFGSGEPAFEVPILYTHGTGDVLIGYEAVGEPLRDDILDAWDFGPGVTIADETSHWAERWTTSGGTAFEMWSHSLTTGNILLGGHCLVGPDDGGTYRCSGGGLDHSELVLAFFADNPRSN